MKIISNSTQKKQKTQKQNIDHTRIMRQMQFRSSFKIYQSRLKGRFKCHKKLTFRIPTAVVQGSLLCQLFLVVSVNVIFVFLCDACFISTKMVEKLEL